MTRKSNKTIIGDNYYMKDNLDPSDVIEMELLAMDNKKAKYGKV